MISSFEVYLVMQLDTVIKVLVSLSIISALLCMPVIVISLTSGYTSTYVKKLGRWVMVTFLLSTTLCSFLPSSKTAAAMIILPKITSSENINALSVEAREMYSIVKDALKGVSKDEKKDTKHQDGKKE